MSVKRTQADAFGLNVVEGFKTMLAKRQQAVSDLNGSPPNPEAAKVCVDQGGRFLDAGDYPKAVAAYEKAISLDPDNVLAWANLGAAYCLLGRTYEGVAATELAKRLQADKKSVGP